ncbi:hypothetical protein [Arthrobacter sp.]|uniref:hypothetical protein n=1 Tax=Arthrobacter sp. TaxID=1667 RepID=UPI003A91939B
MQAAMEIGVVVILTAGLVWWLWWGLTRDAPLARRLGDAGTRTFIWIIAVFMAILAVTGPGPLSVPALPIAVMYVGVAASALFIVAGKVVLRIDNVREGRARRLAGIPSEPNVMNPWASAILAGIIAFVLFFSAFIIGLYVSIQQEMLHEAQQQAYGAAGSGSLAFMDDIPMMMTWVAGSLVLVVLMAFGIQWLRYHRAQREYEELRDGITARLNTALDEIERNSEDA